MSVVLCLSAQKEGSIASTIEQTWVAIERTHVPENSVAADPIMERALEFILEFLGFLGASRVPLTTIYRPVNTKK